MTTVPERPTVVFDEFFEMGLEDSLSPFLTPQSRRYGVNLMVKTSILAAILLFLSYLTKLFPGAEPLGLFLLVGVYFFAGMPALIDSIEDIFRLELNIDVLMTLAAFASILIGSPFEGGLLLVLFALSGSMEDAVTEKAKGAINALYKLAPTTAFILLGDEIKERSVKDIVVGDTLLIKAGEMVPLDGVVLKGSSSLSLAHLTGENTPILKKAGDTVVAGAQNLEGALVLEVTHSVAESTVSRIIKLVTEAADSKPEVQRLFDRFSKRYAAVVISLTALFAVSLPTLFGIPFGGPEGSFYRAVAFLIAASPCALIIATPIAYLSAISALAKAGILLKGGIILDAVHSCSIIAFDKTGTLTKGEPELLDIEPITNGSIEEAAHAAFALEQNAVHPFALAITRFAKEKKYRAPPLENFKAVPGYGLQAKIELQSGTENAFIGNTDFIFPMIRESERTLLEKKTLECRKRGELVAILLLGKDPFLLRFRDHLRPFTKETIEELKKTKRVLMLTGDAEATARAVSQETGIDEYFSSLKPEDKLRIVSELSLKEGLAMVGDGINDAPALARASVGISMGRIGSGAAIEAADVVLLHDTIESLPKLIKKAEKTVKIVKQNLTLASSVILFATTPALLGWIPLWLAVVLHEGGTMVVGLNALRLLDFGRGKK